MNVSATPHILVIDDDPDIRELVAEYLRKNDMRVSAGASGREMFEIVRPGGDRPCPARPQAARRGRHAAGAHVARAGGRADRSADRTQRGGRPRDGTGARGRRLRHQAVQPARVAGPGTRGAATLSGAGDADPSATTHAAHSASPDGSSICAPRRLVSPAGASVELSNGEFSLLNALCRAPQRVLTRDQLLSMSPPARSRGLRSHRRRADPAIAAQDRSGFGQSDADRHRARRRLPARQRGRDPLLTSQSKGMNRSPLRRSPSGRRCSSATGSPPPVGGSARRSGCFRC